MKLPAYIIGTGLVLFVVNQPNFALNKYILISNIGLLLIYIGIMIAIIWIKSLKELTLGSKWLWIPLSVMTVSIMISAGLSDASNKISLIFFAPTLFMLYVLARRIGKDIFVPFMYAVIIASVSIVIHGFLNPGVRNGGLISPTNYDMATGLIVFGSFVCIWKRQYLLLAVAIVGLFFTGADEAIFSAAVMAIAVLIRRDWSKRLLVPIAALILVFSVCTPIGVTGKLYNRTYEKIVYLFQGNLYEATNERYGVDGDFIGNMNIAPVKVFGNGYFVSWDDSYRFQIPHNVPVIVFDQIGIFGGLAWIFATAYLVIKTRWRYAWIAVLSLCVWDHYIWTQAASWYWVLAGVSSASDIKSDLIFKNANTVS